MARNPGVQNNPSIKATPIQRPKCCSPGVTAIEGFHCYTVLLLLLLCFNATHPLHAQTMSTLHDKDELVFLYKLIQGVTCSSYACKVAAAMGIERSIIDRGSEVTELISQNKPVTRRESPAMEHAHTQ